MRLLATGWICLSALSVLNVGAVGHARGAVPLEVISESHLAPVVIYQRVGEMMVEAQRHAVVDVRSETWCDAALFAALGELGQTDPGRRNAGQLQLRKLIESGQGDETLRRLLSLHERPGRVVRDPTDAPLDAVEAWYAQVLTRSGKVPLPIELRKGWRPDYEAQGAYAALARRAVGWVLFKSGASEAEREEGALLLEKLVGQGPHWRQTGSHKGHEVEVVLWDTNVYDHLVQVAAWRARRAIGAAKLPAGCQALLLARLAMILGNTTDVRTLLARAGKAPGPCAAAAEMWRRGLHKETLPVPSGGDVGALVLVAYLRSQLDRQPPEALAPVTERLNQQLQALGFSEQIALGEAGRLYGEALLGAGQLRKAQQFLDDLRLKVYRLERVRGGIRMEHAEPALEVLVAYAYFLILQDRGDAQAARRMRLLFMSPTEPAYTLVPSLRDLDEPLARWWLRLK